MIVIFCIGYEGVNCCVDEVVYWATSKQPFTHLCSDPAQALQMPPQTYLPTGMEGVITCPAASQPPLIRVDWTKDGEPLDLSTVIKTVLCTYRGSGLDTPGQKATDETSAFQTRSFFLFYFEFLHFQCKKKERGPQQKLGFGAGDCGADGQNLVFVPFTVVHPAFWGVFRINIHP